MSTTGTYRGTQSHRTVGRGKLPDFENNSSHIPRPPSSATAHTPASDVGSSNMSAASSRQRQNQSKRDEVCSLFGFGSCLLMMVMVVAVMIMSSGDGFRQQRLMNIFIFRQFDVNWRPISTRRSITPVGHIGPARLLRALCLP